jgi:predicted dehydrogenase
MIRLAIVGTGGMAHGHAKAFAAIRGCRLAAACDVLPDRAAAFAREFGIPAVYSEVDAMLAGTDVDAVTVVTPDASHSAVALKAIARGKHVLCEKPLATDYPDAAKMAAAARRAGVINMVNLSYRNSAAIQKAHQVVEQGELGRIMHVEASYLQGWLAGKHWGDWRTSPAWLWRLSTRHGSNGVLGDIGVHILDFATFAAGGARSVDCRLRTFPKAKNNRIGDYPLDANDSAVITIELAGGGLGTVHTTRWATGHANSLRLRVFGDKGALVVDLDQAWDVLQVCRGADVDKLRWKSLKCAPTPTIYQRFIRSIRTGRNDQPDFARGAAVQKMLDACIESDRRGAAIRL